MVRTLKYLIVTALGLFTYSCYYDELPEANNLPLPANVSFQNDVQPIFNTNCVACHNGTLEPDLRSGNSYNALLSIPGSIVPGSAADSELIEMLEHDPSNPNPMPPSAPMPQATINIVKAWINEGALNN